MWRNDHDALRALVFALPHRPYRFRHGHISLYALLETEHEQMALRCGHFNARNDQEVQIMSGYVVTRGLNPGHRIVVTDRQTVKSTRPRNLNYPLYGVVTVDRIVRVHVQIKREGLGHRIVLYQRESGAGFKAYLTTVRERKERNGRFLKAHGRFDHQRLIVIIQPDGAV
jgi:hypothetical protein